jgi:hypothetical protein
VIYTIQFCVRWPSKPTNRDTFKGMALWQTGYHVVEHQVAKVYGSMRPLAVIIV